MRNACLSYWMQMGKHVVLGFPVFSGKYEDFPIKYVLNSPPSHSHTLVVIFIMQKIVFKVFSLTLSLLIILPTLVSISVSSQQIQKLTHFITRLKYPAHSTHTHCQ